MSLNNSSPKRGIPKMITSLRRKPDIADDK